MPPEVLGNKSNNAGLGQRINLWCGRFINSVCKRPFLSTFGVLTLLGAAHGGVGVAMAGAVVIGGTSTLGSRSITWVPGASTVNHRMPWEKEPLESNRDNTRSTRKNTRRQKKEAKAHSTTRDKQNTINKGHSTPSRKPSVKPKVELKPATVQPSENSVLPKAAVSTERPADSRSGQHEVKGKHADSDQLSSGQGYHHRIKKADEAKQCDEVCGFQTSKTTIDCDDTLISEMPAEWCNNDQIKKYYISHTDIDSLNDTALIGLNNLEVFIMRSGVLMNINHDAFTSNKALRTIYLDGNNITHPEFVS